MTVRVFHVPSHLAYVAKLADEGFTPVPAPSGGPLRVAGLLALSSWDWFDVLHLHTVELASGDELRALAKRARREGKRFVATVHDLQPNIESDVVEFGAKLDLVLDRAEAAATLTEAAHRQLAARGLLGPCEVVPHGTALPLDVLGSISGQPGYGLAAFGALRPNRDLIGLVDAWQLLPEGARPPLRILLRDVTDEDERRDAATLAALRKAAARHEDLALDVQRGFVDAVELVAWLRRSHVLVLPYRCVTHSGQLEVARDVGLGVLAPDVLTLRDQLGPDQVPAWPVTWVPSETVGDAESFAALLLAASSQRSVSEEYLRTFREFRVAEHQSIVDAHAKLYKAALRETV